ncbi:MAG: hypothetical protein R3F33_06420 [Planctomycetota bacterium]
MAPAVVRVLAIRSDGESQVIEPIYGEGVWALPETWEWISVVAEGAVPATLNVARFDSGGLVNVELSAASTVTVATLGECEAAELRLLSEEAHAVDAGLQAPHQLVLKPFVEPFGVALANREWEGQIRPVQLQVLRRLNMDALRRFDEELALSLVQHEGNSSVWAHLAGPGTYRLQYADPDRYEVVPTNLTGGFAGSEGDYIVHTPFPRGESTSAGLSGAFELGAGETRTFETTCYKAQSVSGYLIRDNPAEIFGNVFLKRIRERVLPNSKYSAFEIERGRSAQVDADTGYFSFDGVYPGEYRVTCTSSARENEYTFFQRTFFVQTDPVEFGEIRPEPYSVELDIELRDSFSGESIASVTDALRTSALSLSLHSDERAAPSVGLVWHPGSKITVHGFKALSYGVTLNTGWDTDPRWGDYKLAGPLNAEARFLAGDTTSVSIPVLLQDSATQRIRVPVVTSEPVTSAYGYMFKKGKIGIDGAPISGVSGGAVEMDIPISPEHVQVAAWAILRSGAVLFGMFEYKDGQLTDSGATIATRCEDVTIEFVSRGEDSLQRAQRLRLKCEGGSFPPGLFIRVCFQTGGVCIDGCPWGLRCAWSPAALCLWRIRRRWLLRS